jgi:hypothetical protein
MNRLLLPLLCLLILSSYKKEIFTRAQHQFHVDILQIGDDYQGGKVAYILQPGDAGYDTNVEHGLIAAATDQSVGGIWGAEAIISGTDTALGTGNQNTITIMDGCATAGIAARICGDLQLNGYSDWYLPSKDELNKLHINRKAIGHFVSAAYWSSSHSHKGMVWIQAFEGKNTGMQLYANQQYAKCRARAVRAF